MNTKIVTTFSTPALLFMLVVAALTAVVFFVIPTPVSADHKVVHCEELLKTGDPETANIEYQACVDSLDTNVGGAGNNGVLVGDGSGLTEPSLNGGTEDCNGVDIAIGVGCDPSTDNPITGYANAIINFLAAGVGLVVIIMVATGGVQFMIAGGNPQATQVAIKHITDAFIGLLFFIFLYAFLQWIIPGGPF